MISQGVVWFPMGGTRREIVMHIELDFTSLWMSENSCGHVVKDIYGVMQIPASTLALLLKYEETEI